MTVFSLFGAEMRQPVDNTCAYCVIYTLNLLIKKVIILLSLDLYIQISLSNRHGLK